MKERLIGAAVLVALGVWLIPWVLDGPDPQAETASAELRLPVPEEPLPLRSETIRLGAPASASEVAPERVSPPRAIEPVETSTVAAAEPAARSTAAATRPATETPAKPAGRSSVAQSGWLVQLGSFSEEENARRLAQRVGTYGYQPEISNHRASGRTMYRVRVGPHASRDQAEAQASSLSAHGFVAQVVAAD